MSTYEIPNTLENSTPTVQVPVDYDKIQADLERLQTEWQDGTNTDFSIATGKVANLNTANGYR